MVFTKKAKKSPILSDLVPFAESGLFLSQTNTIAQCFYQGINLLPVTVL